MTQTSTLSVVKKFRWSRLKGLGWTFFTTVAGLLGLILHALHSMIDKAVTLDLDGLVYNGSLLMFSATLAAAVVVDSIFDRTRSSLSRSLKLANWGAKLDILFSAACYIFVYVTISSNRNPGNIFTLTMAALFTALVSAIVAKTITLSEVEGK